MKEFKKENKAMNEWMDETEKLVNSLSVNMDPKKASRVQDKINVSTKRQLDAFFGLFLSLSSSNAFSIRSSCFPEDRRSRYTGFCVRFFT